jgi:hypothetical protein
MERNLHETTSRWKTYGKRLFSEDLEVQDDQHGCRGMNSQQVTRFGIFLILISYEVTNPQILVHFVM